MNLDKCLNDKKKSREFLMEEVILSERELTKLRSKQPSDLERQAEILLLLDMRFGFNRTKLSKFLKESPYFLDGYSRRQIERKIGARLLTPWEYRSLYKVLSKVGEEDLFLLIISKGVRKKIYEYHNSYKGQPLLPEGEENGHNI